MRCIVLWIVLGAGCGAVGAIVPTGVVTVTHEGRILLGGQERSVDGLRASVRDRSGPIEVRADPATRWMHVQWALAALGEAGRRTAACRVDAAGPGAKGTVTVRLTRGLWTEKFWWPLDASTTHWPVTVRVVPGADGDGAEYHLNDTGRTITRSPAAIVRWARTAIATRQDAHGDIHRCVGGATVEASGAVPFRFVAAALAALREAGATGIDVGLEALHPWDRDRIALPPPPHADVIPRWFVTDLHLRPMVPVNLPVAEMSSSDRDDDPDDRIIITLTSTGRLILGKNEATLAGLAARLADSARAYDRKQRETGRLGYEDLPDGRRWSKLFVLLRADRDAPLQHVLWIMAELADHRIYRLQLGADRKAGRSFTPAEAERRWAAREICFPLTLSGKLQCFLSTAPPGPGKDPIDVRVSWLPWLPAQYQVGAESTREREALAEWLARACKEREAGRPVGRVFADPRTPFGAVVTAIDAFARAGIARVDLDGVARAPAPVRRTVPLIRPR